MLRLICFRYCFLRYCYRTFCYLLCLWWSRQITLLWTINVVILVAYRQKKLKSIDSIPSQSHTHTHILVVPTVKIQNHTDHSLLYRNASDDSCYCWSNRNAFHLFLLFVLLLHLKKKKICYKHTEWWHTIKSNLPYNCENFDALSFCFCFRYCFLFCQNLLPRKKLLHKKNLLFVQNWSKFVKFLVMFIIVFVQVFVWKKIVEKLKSTLEWTFPLYLPNWHLSSKIINFDALFRWMWEQFARLRMEQ